MENKLSLRDNKDATDWDNLFEAVKHTSNHVDALHEVIKHHKRLAQYFQGTAFFTQAHYHDEALAANVMLLETARTHLIALRAFFAGKQKKNEK